MFAGFGFIMRSTMKRFWSTVPSSATTSPSNRLYPVTESAIDSALVSLPDWSSSLFISRRPSRVSASSSLFPISPTITLVSYPGA